MDRLEAMSMLRLAVDRGSLSAASRELRVPLPTLSRRISELEARLGARLLIRTTRKLSLTDAGIAYLAAARRILDQVDEAERSAAGEYSTPKGELVLTAPILFGRLHLLPLVTEFLALYPEIDIRLLLSDRNIDLIGDHVDMAVRIGTLPDSAMIATRVGAMRTVICASASLLARCGAPSPDDLRHLPCVSFDMAGAADRWPLHQPGTRTPLDVPIRVRLSVSTAEAAVEAAEAGVGVTRVLLYQAADAIARGTLGIILAEHEPAALPIHILHPGRAMLPLKTRSFLDFAVPRLREALRGFGS